MKIHKLRNSESTDSPQLVEYLQNGVLVRFNIQQETRDETPRYIYDEFWFDASATNIEKVVNEKGFVLTDEHKKLLK